MIIFERKGPLLYLKEVEKYATLHDDMTAVAGRNLWAPVTDIISSLIPDTSRGDGALGRKQKILLWNLPSFK